MNVVPGGYSPARLVHIMAQKHRYTSLANLPDYVPEPPRQYAVVEGGPFNLDWVFTFGKYANRAQLEWVIQADPLYVTWCLENVVGFKLSEAAGEVLARILDELQ